jgi:cell division septation protein DedD
MASTHEDFREIQLTGKQLVFWFMAGIVILVVVFLMGMQVGRGVLMARGAPGGEVAAAAATPESEPPPPPASASPSSSALPATAGEKLSYAERLGAAEPPKESLKAESTPSPVPPSPKPDAPEPATAPPVAAAAPTPKAPAPKAAAPATASTASTEPSGPGFAIQVAALREADEADSIVKRLAGKGYAAYVVRPAKGQPQVYRVRVGKFKDRREADTVAARLQKEEQFKPWIVR